MTMAAGQCNLEGCTVTNDLITLTLDTAYGPVKAYICNEHYGELVDGKLAARISVRPYTPQDAPEATQTDEHAGRTRWTSRRPPKRSTGR